MTVDSIRDECINELACRFGLHVSHRFVIMLENREQTTGKRLNDTDIEDLKVRFESSIYTELLTKRAGK